MRTTIFTRVKRAAIQIVPAAVAALLAGAVLANAQGRTVDRGASDALTSYLREHQLPLVGAQVSRRADGSREVVLYGFVATDFGKGDAESKARQYLQDPKAVMLDRIRVNPEIAHLQPQAGPASAQGSPAASPGDEWEDVMRHIYQNGALPPPSPGAGGFPGVP